VEAAALLRRATTTVFNATKRHKRHLKGVQNRQVWAIRNMVSVLNAGTGQYPEPQAAPQFKKLPQFKTGTNISRTKKFQIEPKTAQFRTPLPQLGPLSRVQVTVQPANSRTAKVFQHLKLFFFFLLLALYTGQNLHFF
jgi:hypothetical protein